MKRRLVQLAIGGCVCLALASVILFIRRNRQVDEAALSYNQVTVELIAGTRSVWIGYAIDSRNDPGLDFGVGTTPPDLWRRLHRPSYLRSMVRQVRFAGFAWGRGDPTVKIHNAAYLGHYLRFPHWFLVLIFAAPPITWLVHRRRRVRRAADSALHLDRAVPRRGDQKHATAVCRLQIENR